ncbi:hypothetical protein Bca101_053397 [Brassica carinata]
MAFSILRSCVKSIGVSRQLLVLESKATCLEPHALGPLTIASKIRAFSSFTRRTRTRSNTLNPPVTEAFQLGSSIISLEMIDDGKNHGSMLCHMDGTTVRSNIIVSHNEYKDDNFLQDHNYCVLVAALMKLNITRAGPIGVIRIGRINENIIINPTVDEQRRSDFNLLYVCTRQNTIMVDLVASEIPESDLATNLKLAQLEAVKCIDSQVKLRERYQRDKKVKLLTSNSKNFQDTRTQSSNHGGGEVAVGQSQCAEIISDVYRFDGRSIHQIRPVHCEAGYLHGSSLISCGETQVLCTATIGMFIEKALLGVIPSHRDFPYAIHLNSTVLASDGSSSTTSVCGGSIALTDAGVPIKSHVAGVSIGLLTDDETSNGQLENYRIITDTSGFEIEKGEMDFKIAGTRNGITAIQLDVKSTLLSLDVIIEALKYGCQAHLQILDHMEIAINSTKETSYYKKGKED